MPELHRDESVSDEDKARALVAVLRAGVPTSAEMFATFRRLDALPVDVVRAELARWMGPLPDLDGLDAATRHALKLPPRALRLAPISFVRDADVLDLGPLAEEQLRIAGQTWDGADLPAEDRLDGELEGSFAGTLRRVVLADTETSPPEAAFDIVLFGEDSGVVFSAGTTKQLALIAYGKVEMRDARARLALESTIAALPAAPEEDDEATTTRSPVSYPPDEAADGDPRVHRANAEVEDAPAAKKTSARAKKASASPSRSAKQKSETPDAGTKKRASASPRGRAPKNAPARAAPKKASAASSSASKSKTAAAKKKPARDGAAKKTTRKR